MLQEVLDQEKIASLCAYLRHCYIIRRYIRSLMEIQIEQDSGYYKRIGHRKKN